MGPDLKVRKEFRGRRESRVLKDLKALPVQLAHKGHKVRRALKGYPAHKERRGMLETLARRDQQGDKVRRGHRDHKE